MAKGAGKAGGGRGKTARSQRYAAQQRANDALSKYGYPSARELRREAQGLAQASVPTVRQVSRPFDQQIRSSADYLKAVTAALAETQAQVGSDYAGAVDQSQATSDAAQARLAGLGLGADAAGTQAAVGARGDNATQNLIANQASAGNYAAQLPAIASGQATQFADVTRNKLLDALGNRRDALSQAFFQALQQVQGNALQRASFNQSADQFNRNMTLQEQQMAQSASQFAQSQAASAAQATRSFNEQVREFNLSRKDAQKQAATTAGLSPSEWRQEAKIVADATGGTPAQTAKIPQYGPAGHVNGYRIKTIQPAGPNVAEAGQHFDQVLQGLIQQGVNPQVAIPMLEALYTTPFMKNAPRGTDQYAAYQSYLKFSDPHYGHHPYEGEHGQTFVP